MKKMFIYFATIFVLSNVVLSKNVKQYSNIIEAIDKGLTYILDNPDYFNVDGLFGITFAISNLEAIRKSGYNNKVLKHLERLSKNIYETIYPMLETDGSDEIFRQTLLKPELLDEHINFVLNVFDKNYEKVPINNYMDLIQYYLANPSNETAIDYCFSELITNQQPNGDCPISKDCKEFIIDGKPNDAGYVISHELLYLIISRMRNCSIRDINWYNKKIKSYCNDMLFEVKTMAKLKYPTSFNDLFLEHITLCGYSGFADFFKKEYIDQVLNMQTPEGCFNPREERRRVKRKANLDPNGCFDHTNGLGISTLTIYLRYSLVGS